MKFHRNLINAVVNGLEAVLLQGRQADSTVEKLLGSNKGWGSRDRAFIADNIYTIIRYKRLYEYSAAVYADSPANLYLLLGAKLLLDGIVLPEWQEFNGLVAEEVKARAQQAEHIRKIKESIPDWLDELGEKELGADWEAELHALNTPARFTIRVNTLKTTQAALLSVFDKEGINYERIEGVPDGLLISGKKNFRSHYTYQSGWFEIQDASSQLVAPFLAPQSGSLVIDACAGGGGKSLHIAALMQNKGEIIAMDISAPKLEELGRRAKRNGATILHTKPAEKATIDGLAQIADYLLLDVPCSGSGVLRRKPDAKWKLTPAFLEEIKTTQASILTNYSQMLKKGGTLVYSTCSVFPSENGRQIEKFLSHSGDFEIIEQQSISPAKTGFDGFYMAKLMRKG